MNTRLRQLGQVAGAAVAGLFIPRSAIEVALENDKTRAHGYAMGLTEDQVEEITRTWLDWYRANPYPVDWNRIRLAQVQRVCMQEWRP